MAVGVVVGCGVVAPARCVLGIGSKMLLCRNPYVGNKGFGAYPCGRCGPCLQNKKRTWTHRIMLESLCHEHNCFITLTYSDEHLPIGGSLAPEDFQNWLKRFRKSIEPARIRFYGVGEYGDKTRRPHYHAAIFGYPKCVYGLSRYNRERESCCVVCDTVRDTWGLGNVLVGSLETKSAQYVAGYIQKKMTRFDDPRLGGRLHPEFCRMSLRPGIGADAMHDVASVLLGLSEPGKYQSIVDDVRLVAAEGDVPSTLRHGSRLMPLGRYLRRKLREYTGKEVSAPPETLEAMEQEVRDLLEAQGIDTQTLKGDLRKTVVKNAVVDASAQRVLNMETRRAIYERKKVL